MGTVTRIHVLIVGIKGLKTITVVGVPFGSIIVFLENEEVAVGIIIEGKPSSCGGTIGPATQNKTVK